MIGARVPTYIASRSACRVTEVDGESRADLGCSGADTAPTVSTLPIPRVDFLTEQVDHPCRPPCWRSISQRYSQAAARTRLRHYGAHRAACHRRHQAWRRHGQESGQQLPARPPAPLARAGADPVAELLTAAACRSSSMNRCGDPGLRARIMESAQPSGSPYKIGYLPVTVRFSGWRTSRL